MSNSEADDHQNSNDTPSRSTTPPTAHQPSVNTPAKLIEHFMANKVDVAMWILRLLAIIFAFGYVLPIFGNRQSAFNKVLLSNAAVSALRLHQRIPSFTFTREFLTILFLEDSCHYLMYSLIFWTVQPTPLILAPIVLFAILHASSYSLKLLDIIGQNSWWGARFLISLVEFQASSILKIASFCEILIMPFTVIMTFMGRAGIMQSIVYYHFLGMRYRSRRNPYTRNAFAELRMMAESLAAQSPHTVAYVIRGGIAFVSRLAPTPQPMPTQ